MPLHRRTLLSAAALSAAAPTLTLAAESLAGESTAAGDSDSQGNPVCVFTKPFNSLSFDVLAAEIAGLGFAGIEAPIRPGGHIEPEQVEEQLPRLVESLRDRGLEVTVMTSSLNDPDDPLTEKVIRTAATLGIKRYRMKYFHYDEDRPVREQIADWHDRFDDLAALNHDYGMTGLYQNHAGAKYLGAAIWDLAEVLRGIEPADLAVAYDIRHATVEGGTSWPITFRMIRDHVDTVYVKDFVWNGAKMQNVPLGEGLVKPKFFEMLRQTDFRGPISLHEEYLDHRDPALVPKHLAAIKRDYEQLKQLLAG
jgi:sugar phosphate isomerase/epimerase